MGNLGWTEMFFIVVFALIVFGPRKLPDIARTLGQAVAQLRRASEEFKHTWEAEATRDLLKEKQELQQQLNAVTNTVNSPVEEDDDDATTSAADFSAGAPPVSNASAPGQTDDAQPETLPKSSDQKAENTKDEHSVTIS